jgi:small subunit ribosomal protein S16
MAVKIRLARHGSKKRPFYIEQIGVYDPRARPSRVEFRREKLVEWLRKGAQPTQTVAQLIERAGIDASSG